MSKTLCGIPLREETTGFYPFHEGYICQDCRDKSGEEFCRAVDAYDAAVEEDVDMLVEMLRLL